MEENTSEEVSELKNDDKKSIYDVLNMEGNDELKFGLLISLIKLKQVSDRDVVNGILNLLVGGEFDLESNFILKDSNNVKNLLNLLPSCTEILEAEILTMLTAILRKSQRNLQVCNEISLISLLLKSLPDDSDMIADIHINLLSLLSSYSVSVKELRLLIGLLKADNNQWSKHSVKLLTVLQTMRRTKEANEFFTFPGTKSSAIHLPPMNHWPQQTGWTFHCWLRINNSPFSGEEASNKYLYSLLTSKDLGYTAHFSENNLIITVMKAKGKGVQHCIKHDFIPSKWTMVTISHVYNRWTKNELQCYIDGQLVSQTEMAWYIGAAEVFERCNIGGIGMDLSSKNCFNGQLASIYMFSDSLTCLQIQAMYELGRGYKSQFRFECESKIDSHFKKILYDGRLTGLVSCMYTPVACDGQLCLDSKPRQNVSPFTHAPHALMLGDVQAIRTGDIHSTLHSVGGIQILLPLFGQIDYTVEGQEESYVDYTICEKLISLICELIMSSQGIQDQMIQNKGFLVISYYLEKASSEHITVNVFASLISLIRHLITMPITPAPLLRQIFDYIVFNPSLWVKTSMQVQVALYSYLSSEFVLSPVIYSHLRRVQCVTSMMYSLKHFYSQPGKDISLLRAYQLLFIKKLVLHDPGMHADEMKCILNYLCTVTEKEYLYDVLYLLVQLMKEHPASMVPAFHNSNGVRTIFKLLESKSELIRILSLKLFGFYLQRSTLKRKTDTIQPHNLFSLIGEFMLKASSSLTMTTYNALFELLTESMTMKILHHGQIEPDASFRIENSAILKVMVVLLNKSEGNVMSILMQFLTDLTTLCKSSKENCRTVLQMSIWQDWLFSLAFVYPEDSEQLLVTDHVMELFRLLHHHALKLETGGWRVWIDTLSILHAKISYEDFRQHMKGIYDEYERSQLPQVSSTDEQRSHPISTVSGIADKVRQTTRMDSSGEPGPCNISIKQIESLDEVIPSPESKKDSITAYDILGIDESVVNFIEVAIHRELCLKSKSVVIEQNYKPNALASNENLTQEVQPDEIKDNAKFEDNIEDIEVDIEQYDNHIAEIENQDDRTNEVKPQITEDNHNNITDEKSIANNGEIVNHLVNNADKKVHSDTENVSPSEKSCKERERIISSGDTNETNSDTTKVIGNSNEQHVEEEEDVDIGDGDESNTVDIKGTEEGNTEDKVVTEEEIDEDNSTKAVSEEKEKAAHNSTKEEKEASEEEEEIIVVDDDELSADTKSSNNNRPTEIAVDTSNSFSSVTAFTRASSITVTTSSAASLVSSGDEDNATVERIASDVSTLDNSCHSNADTITVDTSTVEVDVVSDSSIDSDKNQRRPNYSNHTPQPRFRVPEFKWSFLHQNLLSSVLSSLEADVLAWKTDNTKSVIEHVNSVENQQFVINVIHMISQLSDDLVTACGGLLPLLAAATSPNGEVDVLEHGAGLNVTEACQFLQRVMNMADILVFASSQNFAALEQEKMRSGGILRQCLRLACTCAVRNCLECRHELTGASHTCEPILELITAGKNNQISSDMLSINNLVKDIGKLLQDMDINRLRAVIYRDVEETKQAQFLSLAIVYFVSVLMVSKYRDILDPFTAVQCQDQDSADENIDYKRSYSNQKENSPVTTPTMVETRLSDIEPSFNDDSSEVKVHASTSSTSVAVENELNVNKELCLEEVYSQDDQPTTPPSPKSTSVPADLPSSGEPDDQADTTTCTTEPHTSTSAATITSVEVNKDPATPINDDDGTAQVEHSNIMSGDDETNDPAAVHTTTEIASISIITKNDNIDRPATLHLNTEVIQPELPTLDLATDSSNVDLTSRLEHALGSAAPLLREIFIDFAPFLSKALLGSHGQELLIGGLVTMQHSTSVVELVMLLCSQEWQNSLQKNAGLAFIELVNEGRVNSHSTHEHIVRVANEADFILTRLRANDVQKHEEFKLQSDQSIQESIKEEKLIDHMMTSSKLRDKFLAKKLKDKTLAILQDKHGAWSYILNKKDKPIEYWKLDNWEDDSRRKRRLVKNLIGSKHPEATLKATIEHGGTEDAINIAREALHSHLLTRGQGMHQEQESMAEEDLYNIEGERDVEVEFSGPVALSVPCKLICPAGTVQGTLSITRNELYFEVADSSSSKPEFQYIDYLHGKWHFNEIRAIFGRRYLLQPIAIEIFVATRTAVMFAFNDNAAMKKVVQYLPKVGVGLKYGLPQNRRVSLAPPKLLYKMSGMMARWQRREITNFDYLMYLNTVAGRSYNDLNQYPIYPWVIINYESNELDLDLASNYRDLSKPIGALNPTRKQFFEQRYEKWEHETIPPFHYGTHYSTSAFVLNWLIRVEPYTTYFLQFQGGKFDHADRTFHSVLQSWKNCQRDTSDVKELIPEWYYLPDMFTNCNDFKLGSTDTGRVVGDVLLPPWAKTAEDFVRINRMALESEFVSCQLHHWIDLIFGYKQRGAEAVRSTNVFYHLSYEGNVNLNNIHDPMMREALENQIKSFGQVPSQLITEPHPPRNSRMHLNPMMFTTQRDDVAMLMKYTSNAAVIHVSANTHSGVPTPAVITISSNHNFAINKWNNAAVNAQYQNANSTTFSDKTDATSPLPIQMDQVLVFGTNLQKRNLGDNFDERVTLNHNSFCVTADNQYIIATAFWDKSFRLYNIDTGKIMQVLYGHHDVVTCISRSESTVNQDCYIVTGSKDCTVLVWHWHSRQQRILGDNSRIDDATPKAILTGHQSEILNVIVSAELGIVVSSSIECDVLIHSNSGDLLRSLSAPDIMPSNAKPTLLALSREGFILVLYHYDNRAIVTLYTNNGEMLKYTKHNDSVQSMIVSRDGQYMMLGGTSGVVEVWRVHDLSVLYAFPICEHAIKSLTLSYCQRYLIGGLAAGSIVVFNIDFNRWHHELQNRFNIPKSNKH